MLSTIWRRLAAGLGRNQQDQELDEEVRGHYDDLRESLEHDGHSPEDAARMARLRLGGQRQIREASQDAWRFGRLEDLWQDLRLAARNLYRRPGFTAAAVATLALGIGASTAIFSVAYGVSLRPLPYPDPDRLVRLYEANPADGQLEVDVSEGSFHDWREGASSIESAARYSKPSSRTFVEAGGARLVVMSVSPAFFDVLGVQPVRGPGFKAETAYTRFTLDDMILSHSAARRIFGDREDVVGATVTLEGVAGDDPYRVAGVLPAEFTFTEAVDAWLPVIVEVPVHRMLRNWRYDRVIARLRPGATIDQARAELEGVSARIAQQFPTSNAGWTVTVRSMHESIVGDFGRATWLLLAAVAVVLLVACLNVGGLLVARAVSRQRETAVRVALGAGSWRLLRLWLAEAALVCGVGAALGLILAWQGLALLRAAAPPGIPRIDAISLDWPTIVVAALSAVVAAAIFTAAPLGRAPGRHLSAGLRAGTHGAGDSRGRQTTRIALTVAQCAGAAALVVLAAMLTRSFANLNAVDLGWRAEGLLSLKVDPSMPPEIRRPWYARVEWSDRLIERLEATAGIERAAITIQLPLGANSYPSTLARGRGRGAEDDTRWSGIQHSVTDGYFEVMDIRIVSGRSFNREDRFSEPQINQTGDRPDHGVAIVTEATARALWPGQEAVGQALWLPDIDNTDWREVVGVVEDIQFGNVAENPATHVFVPWTQTSSGPVHVMVRTTGAPALVGATARDVVMTVEPGAVVDGIATMASLVERATAQPRFTSRLVTGFGLLALTLAAVGIYGTLSYLVGTRTREIGIRLALGAPTRSIASNVLLRGLLPAIAGGAAGFGVALLLARTFELLLFDIEPADPASFLTAAGVLLAVALAAALGPARRAAKVNPVAALKE